jgi:argininosuccinate synthase
VAEWDDLAHPPAGLRRGTSDPIAKDKRGEAPFSVANLLHSSSEGKLLEDPAVGPDEIVFQHHLARSRAGQGTEITIDFVPAIGGAERRDPVPGHAADAVERTRQGQRHRPPGSGREPLRRHEVARHLRNAGRHHPAGGASRIESITLDREAGHLKDSLMPRYAEIIYNGFWFSPERRMLQAIDETSIR